METTQKLIFAIISILFFSYVLGLQYRYYKLDESIKIYGQCLETNKIIAKDLSAGIHAGVVHLDPLPCEIEL